LAWCTDVTECLKIGQPTIAGLPAENQQRYPATGTGAEQTAAADRGTIPAMRRPRLQFSVRWILAATATVAVWVGLWTAEPSEWLGAVELFLVLAVPSVSAAALNGSTGAPKSFGLGVLISTSLAAVFTVSVFADEAWQFTPTRHTAVIVDTMREAVREVSRYGRFIVFLWGLSLLVGVLCCGLHWFLARANSLDDA
jgi:hypothetical protein